MHHLTCGIGSLLHSVNLILFTVLLVHLILRISPHHSHHLRSHHLLLPLPFTPDLKLISFTNPFLHSHSYSFRTDFLYWIKGAPGLALFVLVSGFVYEIKLYTQLSSTRWHSSIVSYRIVYRKFDKYQLEASTSIIVSNNRTWCEISTNSSICDRFSLLNALLICCHPSSIICLFLIQPLFYGYVGLYHFSCGISSLLRSVNLITVHLISTIPVFTPQILFSIGMDSLFSRFSGLVTNGPFPISSVIRSHTDTRTYK